MELINVNVGGHLTMIEIQAIQHDHPGIYLVYRINSEDGRLRLIYIGKSVEVSERVGPEHEHYSDWISWAGGDQTRLRFSHVILLDHEDELLRCEAAMIRAFQPPINTQGKDSFSYPDTTVCFSGRQVCCRSSIVALNTI